jgi:hypothetical protein
MRLLIAALMLIVARPAMADGVKFPVSIPQECFELAQREGVPTVMQNRYQATKAKIRLYRLSGHDPLVRECREAVERAKHALQYNDAATMQR